MVRRSARSAYARTAGGSRAARSARRRACRAPARAPPRLELVDAICERFDENPALLAIREVVELPDADAALAETIAAGVRFWSSEDPILRQLYGVVAIDPAAQALVERQRADRRGEMRRLVRHLQRAGRLRGGLSGRQALSLLMVLTSYETFCELRLAGSGDGRSPAPSE